MLFAFWNVFFKWRENCLFVNLECIVYMFPAWLEFVQLGKIWVCESGIMQ